MLILKYFFSIVLVIAGIIAAAGFAILFTTGGSWWLVEHLASDYISTGQLVIEKMNGNLARGMVFTNIEAKGFKKIPAESTLKIDQLILKVPFFDYRNPRLNILNGRLQLPSSEPIVFSGNINGRFLDLNIFCHGLVVEDILRSVSVPPALKRVNGGINDVDLYVVGYFKEPSINGTFYVEHLRRFGTTFDNAPGMLALKFASRNQEFTMKGVIRVDAGLLAARRIKVNLDPSRVLFHGPMRSTTFDLAGSSQVEETKINITLRGTARRPELTLTSNPPAQQDKLLFMLVTGKGWAKTESMLTQGRVSMDIVRDFVDYFLFSGSGDKMANAFGIEDVYLKFTGETRGIGIQKGRLGVGYSVQQTRQELHNVQTQTEKFEGDYVVTRNVSLGVEHAYALNQEPGQSPQGETLPDDRVLIKFRTNF